MAESDWQKIYVTFLYGGLFLVGVWHLIAGAMTENIFRAPRNVRLAGVFLAVMAGPCLAWPRPYFIVAGITLLVSGILRALAPKINIQLQKETIPRWGHGVVIVAVSVFGYLAYHWNWVAH